MRVGIYSIFDSVAAIFNKPFTDLTDASAQRGFSQSVVEQAHKNDLSLYKLAVFDDSNGQVEPLQEPLRLMSGLDVIDQE